MQKIGLALLVFAFALLAAHKFPAQTQTAPPATPHLPRGTATDVSAAEIQSLVEKTAADRVSDQAVRVVSINGEYNVGVGVVHRAKTSGAQAGGGTGGSMDHRSEFPTDHPVVAILNGPSTRGGPIQNGVTRKIGSGDVVIIPPNTPHWFSEITSDQIVYLVVRVDPHRVLPAGYVAK